MTPEDSNFSATRDNHPRSPADTSGSGLPTSSARCSRLLIMTANCRRQLLHFGGWATAAGLQPIQAEFILPP